ncbi:MAG: hypothetical protein DHS20C16_33490 [Phycisphaerae bacterium]|nr:MAG: hypothetical protein DHS20C16_33490 [Phycisphaerae bacterium]
MNAFQWIVLPILVLLIIERFVTLLRGNGSRRVALFWGLVWCGAAIAIAWPDLTTSIASGFGLRRGADLVMYFAILFGFVGFYMIYVRMRRLDANLTLLVRKLAIENPVSSNDNPKRDASGNKV